MSVVAGRLPDESQVLPRFSGQKAGEGAVFFLNFIVSFAVRLWTRVTLCCIHHDEAFFPTVGDGSGSDRDKRFLEVTVLHVLVKASLHLQALDPFFLVLLHTPAKPSDHGGGFSRTSAETGPEMMALVEWTEARKQEDLFMRAMPSCIMDMVQYGPFSARALKSFTWPIRRR